MTVTEFLKSRVPFLSGLEDDQARALAEAAQQVVFNRGQTILFRGVTVEGLHVMATGRASVWVKPDKNRPMAAVAALGPGEIFGETSILEMSTAGATVKAEEDETLVFIIPQDAFRAILDRNPGLKARAEALIALRKQAAAPAKPT